MCDYSLMTAPNRLAQEGEELVVHRFYTGSLGLASPADIHRASEPKPKRSIWAILHDFFSMPEADSVCAVCIPPGARLELQGLSNRMQRELAVQPVEQVTFTQITAAVNTYRDAVRFSNGREVRLQELREGLRVKVLDLSMAEELNLKTLREQSSEVLPVR